MDKVANQAQGMVSDTRTVADWLYRTGEEMRDELKKGMDMAKEDIQRATESFKDEVSKLNEAAASATNGMDDMGGCQNDGELGLATYADTLNRWLPVAHLSTLARSQVKERQVLIDKDLVAELNSWLTSMSANLWQLML